MRKLVNGEYVMVEDVVDAAGTPDARFVDVIDADDVDEMNPGQLIDFLRRNGVNANRSWKPDTLRAKAYAMLRGEG